MRDFIPLNKPYFTGNETNYIEEAMASRKIAGGGFFTEKCESFLENKYGFKKVLLTNSCTAALEMSAMLINTQPGDEIIIPSFTFVSTANAFVLRGAKIIFADNESGTPNIDTSKLESLITPKTKAIVCVHYGGIACDMDAIMHISEKNNLYVIEDAAHAIDGFYKDKPLGSIGHLAAFSFHETKNISCGEGGMLVINDESFRNRAEIIREKGTNRNKFLRGEIKQYEWVDIGSSFVMSEITAAFLWAQLEQLDLIQKTRKKHWNYYYHTLKPLEDRGFIALPKLPDFSSNNAHLFYLLCKNNEERTNLTQSLNNQYIKASFHYLGLHQSSFYKKKYTGNELINSDKFMNGLLRLPLFFELGLEDINHICQAVKGNFEKLKT